jgi:selenide,water dikinase
LAQAGFVTGASHRNWASYSEHSTLPAGLPDWRSHQHTAPQTSGGLLVASAPAQAEAIVRTIISAGYPHACIIGRAAEGKPGVTIA